MSNFFPELETDPEALPDQSEWSDIPGDIKLQVGNCHRLINAVQPNSVALALFSPPYDAIRQYGGDYSFNLSLLGTQLFRVLRPGGVAVMVIQDQIIDGARSLTSIRTTLEWCDKAGFKLFDMLVYSRHGAPGAQSHYRFRVDHEYMPVFLKGDKPAYFHPDHLVVPAKTAGHVFASGAGRRMADGTMKYGNKVVAADVTSRGTIWHYTVAPSRSRDAQLKFKHPATFSDKLAWDHVNCWAEPGALVLDPFLGSGSTAVACLAAGRRFVGFDVNENYVNIAKERCAMIARYSGKWEK